MLEAIGDIWTYPSDAICITTNGVVKANGELVMGAGIAKQAADRISGLATSWGKSTQANGNTPAVFTRPGQPTLISFPTKYNWRHPADLDLIHESAKSIAKIAIALRLTKVVLTRPGCGLGGLKWEDVKPVIEPILDDGFTVLTPS